MPKNNKLTYEELEEEIVRSHKTINALMSRVENSFSTKESAFSLFENNIHLTSQVKKRTEELSKIADELEKDRKTIHIKNEDLIKANEKIKESFNYNIGIINALSDMLVVVDLNNVIIDVNKKVCEFYKLKRDILIGKKFENIFNFSLKEGETKQNILDAKNWDKKNLYVEMDLVTQNEIVIPCVISQSYLLDQDQKLKYFILLIRDVSELKQMEEIVAVERMKSLNSAKLASLGEMAGGIAHEINNPLTIISTTVFSIKKTMSKGQLTDEFLTQSMDRINTTLARISKIISGLKTISRESSDIKKEKVLLKSIFDDVLGLCTEKLKSTGVNLYFDQEAKELNEEILCDQIQISQVLINLINNSYDAIGHLDDKWIKIEFDFNQNNKVIKIIDSGHGISEEQKAKIFMPFFTTKEIGKGTGLGLSLSKTIMEKHQGSLQIDTKNKNTCFILQFPA